MSKNKAAQGLALLKWKGKSQAERKAHSDMMNKAKKERSHSTSSTNQS